MNKEKAQITYSIRFELSNGIHKRPQIFPVSFWSNSFVGFASNSITSILLRVCLHKMHCPEHMQYQTQCRHKVIIDQQLPSCQNSSCSGAKKGMESTVLDSRRCKVLISLTLKLLTNPVQIVGRRLGLLLPFPGVAAVHAGCSLS